MVKEQHNTTLTFEDFKTEVINDYKLAITSRECSLLGRKEVLTGKAKFGIWRVQKFHIRHPKHSLP